MLLPFIWLRCETALAPEDPLNSTQLFQDLCFCKLAFDDTRKRANDESRHIRTTILFARLGNAKVLIYYSFAKVCRMNCFFGSRHVMAILYSSFNASFWVELPKNCRVTSSNIANTLSVTIAATFITFTLTYIRRKFESLVNQYLRNKLIDIFFPYPIGILNILRTHKSEKCGVGCRHSFTALPPPPPTKSACFAG